MKNKYFIDKAFFLSFMGLIFLTIFTIILIVFGFNISSMKIFLNFSEIISFISAYIILWILSAIILSKNIIIDSDIRNIIRKKYKPYTIANIFFICICILGIQIFSNTNIKKSLGAIAFLAIVFMFFFQRVLMISMQNYKDNLYALTSSSSSNYECNLLWRYKIWTSPKEKTDLTLSNLSLIRIALFLISYIVFIFTKNILFKIIFLILLLIQIFYIIEITLGLYTSLTGICTERYVIEPIGRSYIRKKRTFYRYIITDFNAKREISIFYNTNLDLKVGDRVTVIHSAFLKKIYMVNDVVLKDKFELN